MWQTFSAVMAEEEMRMPRQEAGLASKAAGPVRPMGTFCWVKCSD